MNSTIKVDVAGEVVTVRIDREQRRIALAHHTVAALRQALKECAASSAKLLVLTGAGNKAFCAGDDLKAYADRTPEESRAHSEQGLRLMVELAAMPCLTIAAVEGYCIGGGLELALNCDFRFAGEGSTFALPEVRKLNTNPTWGGLTNLPAVVGLTRAKRLVFLGERWSADQAFEAGLVDSVTETGHALSVAQDEAAAIAREVDFGILRDAKAIMQSSVARDTSGLALLNLLAERSRPFQG